MSEESRQLPPKAIQPPPMRPPLAPVEPLAALFAEVGRLVLELKELRLNGPGVNLLRILQDFGPQTVPQMARLRGTSRQNIQVLVNALRRAGCVELTSNSVHKRSVLVRLTPRGTVTLAAEAGREKELLRRMSPHFPEATVGAATDLVSRVRRWLAAEKAG